MAIARERAHSEGRARPGLGAGALVNLALRLGILYFTLESLLSPLDPRFAGKSLGARNLIVLLGLSMLFPSLQLIKKRWVRYPVWFDSVYLSMFCADMLGNSLDLFNRYRDFDMLPHFYGPGAVAIVLAGAFNVPVLAAWLTVQGLHALLELNEWLGDAVLGTRNVRGWWDTARDLGAGLVGATLYLWAFCCWRSPSKHAPERDEAERDEAERDG
jgi:hypothetical protein